MQGLGEKGAQEGLGEKAGPTRVGLRENDALDEPVFCTPPPHSPWPLLFKKQFFNVLKEPLQASVHLTFLGLVSFTCSVRGAAFIAMLGTYCL